MKTDIEIANSAKLEKIEKIASKIGIKKEDLVLYGNHVAKTKATATPKAKLILVTAINPTSAGEGKTTVSIGLADGMNLLNKNTALALREPSLGPVFGIKGGAAGGGYAQVVPMENINLHFTGDFHAITSANNLLSAVIDNHMYWNKTPRIKEVYWKRTLDMNDRALRNTVVGLGYNSREEGFNITAASEIMAILSLSKDEEDLKFRLGNILIGEDFDGNEIKAKDLQVQDAMAILLKDAINPNLVQTLEGTPAFIHCGPFANIAHGCNSVIATKTAMSYADYVVTEAGFGADLGAEKFLDIKCRYNDLSPDTVVVVATIRALKCAGGMVGDFSKQDNKALEKGMANLEKHLQNLKEVYSLDCVVAINKFATDTDEEIAFVKNACLKLGVDAQCCECFLKGGAGSTNLAKVVAEICDKKNKGAITFPYEKDDSVDTKINLLSQKIYGAKDVKFSPKAKAQLEKINNSEYKKYPVCVAKTQYSLSDNASLLGRPTDFTITIKELQIRSGAGFIVAIAGDMLLMPGLSKNPNSQNMKLEKGVISGLF